MNASPPDRLFDEISHMLVDVIAEDGSPVEVMSDASIDPQELDTGRTVVLVGDGLLFQRTAELMRNGSFDGHVVLWQLEPFPAPKASGGHPGTGDRTVTERLASAVETLAYRFVRPLVSPSVRRTARRLQHRLLPDRVDDDLRDARRFERVRWIQRATIDGWLDSVFVSSPDRAEILSDVGVKAEFAPIGHHPDLEPQHGDRERSIDVLFLGHVKRERKGIVAEMDKKLARHGVRLTVEEGPVFGRSRAELLSRARVSLSLAGTEQELTRFRVVASMAARSAVVAENVPRTEPFDERHLVLAPRARIARAIVDLLDDEERRLRMTERAYDFLVRDVSMADAARRLVPPPHVRRR